MQSRFLDGHESLVRLPPMIDSTCYPWFGFSFFVEKVWVRVPPFFFMSVCVSVSVCLSAVVGNISFFHDWVHERAIWGETIFPFPVFS